MSELRLGIDDFLQRNWQREHLYIPAGISDFTPPIDANDLAGLAMEAEADARIVFATNEGWQQQRGPFSSDDFQRPGAWTLLVQQVDRYWQSVAALQALCNFLPDWRFDDVLMSYATDGGSAAPHFDRYDVFIVQGDGQRRWQIGEFCDSTTPVVDDGELMTLRDFEPREEYILSTGDVLYIPPGCSHYGVSLGESTSFSLGFRAPRVSDLLARWADSALEGLSDTQLYEDRGRAALSHPGEITSEDCARGIAQLEILLKSGDKRWFGEAVTHIDFSPEPQDMPPLSDNLQFRRDPDARLAWAEQCDQCLLFANGESLPLPIEFKALLLSLCDKERQLLGAWFEIDQHEARAAVSWLWELGAISFD